MMFTFVTAAAALASLGAHAKDCGGGLWFIDTRQPGNADIGECVDPEKDYRFKNMWTEPGPCPVETDKDGHPLPRDPNQVCSWWIVPEQDLYYAAQCTGFCGCNFYPGNNQSYLKVDSWCFKAKTGIHCRGGKWHKVQDWFGGSTWLCRPDSELSQLPSEVWRIKQDGYDKERSGFSLVRNAAISGHNTKHLTNASVGVCKTECLRYPWCKSFDYYKGQSTCDLSDVTAADVGGLKTDYSGNPFDYYERQEKGNDGRRRMTNTASRQITMAGAPSDSLIAPEVPNLERRRASKED